MLETKAASTVPRRKRREKKDHKKNKRTDSHRKLQRLAFGCAQMRTINKIEREKNAVVVSCDERSL